MATVLGKFAQDVLKKFGTDEIRLFLMLNLAQAFKWDGKNDKCAEIVRNEDWTGRGYQIRLAVAILRDEYAEAAELMKRIGANGEVKEHDYKDWPIFREFRSTPEFLGAFHAVYGKPFAPVEKIVMKATTLHQGNLKFEFAYEGDLKMPDSGEQDYAI